MFQFCAFYVMFEPVLLLVCTSIVVNGKNLL